MTAQQDKLSDEQDGLPRHVTYFTENYRRQIIRGVGGTLNTLVKPLKPDPKIDIGTEDKLIDSVIGDVSLLCRLSSRVTREKDY